MSKSAFATMLLVAAFAAASAPAHAATFVPNYIFPDGSIGFALTSQGGVVNPGVLVGFNPQPDPPAFDFAPTTMSLDHPSNPVLVSPGPCRDTCPANSMFRIEMSLLGIGNAHLGVPPEPDSQGNTGLTFTALDHRFILALNVSGPGSVVDWVAFNPQPDPPATWFAMQFAYGDPPQLSFRLFEDGNQTPLQFQLATPLPAAWTMMLAGFAGLGLLLRRSRRRASFA